MTTTDKNPRTFMGLTITGEIHYGEHPIPQRPLEEFTPLAQAVLDDPTVVAFGWKQYTPGYNDGDPCTFGTSGFWLATVEDAANPDLAECFEEDGDTYQLDVDDYHPSLGKRPFIKWEGEYGQPDRRRVMGPYEGPDPDRHDRAHALAEAVDRGEFHDVLLENFGDPARVRFSREGIEVTYYEPPN